MIYFVQADGIGHIKIGFTDADDVSARLRSLQTASPVPLKLLGTIPGTMKDEKNLHCRFARARVCGEWFKPVPELLRCLDEGLSATEQESGLEIGDVVRVDARLVFSGDKRVVARVTDIIGPRLRGQRLDYPPDARDGRIEFLRHECTLIEGR